MNRSRTTGLLVACVVVVSITGVAVPATVAGQTNTQADDRTDVQISSVSVTPNDPGTGESVTVETSIANLESSSGPVDITDIYLRSADSTDGHGRIENVGSVSSGGSVSVPMTTSFESAGQKRLTVHVVVRDDDGDHHSYEYPVYVDVADPTVKAGLSTSDAPNQSEMTQVELTNFGNTNLTDVEITATANGETFDRQYVFDVDPGSSQSATFDTGNVSADNVTFAATYAAAGSNHTTSRTVDLASERVQGEIRLTGIETTRTGSGVTIQGDAANIGSTDVESALVRIGDGDGVSPASPSGEYFIGAVDASEFATFELTGTVESGTTSVPVEITYIVGGERVTTTQRIDAGSTGPSAADERNQVNGANGQEPAAEAGGSGGGGLPLVPIGVALLLVAVGVGLFRRHTR